MEPPPLTARSVVKRYGGKPALRGVTLRLKWGEVHALVGPNGAGKTTFIRVALGLLSPDEGEVELLGGDPRLCGECRASVGYVGERLGFTCASTVRGEVLVHCILRLGDEGECERLVDDALAEVGLSELASASPCRLSRGQRQRLALARAVVHKPKLLILDEPLRGLDPEWRSRILRFISSFASRGGAVLLSSHILSDVERVASSVTVLYAGRVLYTGSLEGLLAAASRGVVEARVEASSVERVEAVLQGFEVEEASTRVLVVRVPRSRLGELLEALARVHEWILRLEVGAPSLEEAYALVTRGEAS